MATDALLLALLAVGFFVGFFRGTIRAVLAMAAWAVCFLFASYLRVPLGEWLAGSASFTSSDAYLAAYAAIFFALFIMLVLIIMLSRAATAWTRHAVVDDMLGGIAALAVTVLVIAAVLVMLDSHYATASPSPGEVGLAADIQRALSGSNIATFIGDSVVDGIAFVLGPLLPPDIRQVMA